MSFLLAVGLVLSGCDGDIAGPDPVQPGNPVADAGPDQEVSVGDEVTLDGSGSSHPDGDALTFSWDLETPDGSNAELSDASAVQPTFVADEEGTYTATLTVESGGATDQDAVVITAVLDLPDETQEISSTISDDMTLSSDVLYIVTGNIGVSATLTIEPGTRIEFEQGTSLELGSDAVLIAEGTPDEPILLTGTNQTPGWWHGVHVSNTTHPDNVMNYVTIEYGGGEAFHGSVEPANLTLARSLRDASITVKNSTLRHSAGVGLFLHSNGALPDSENNTYTGNEQGAAAAFTNVMHYFDSGSSFIGNLNGNDLVWVDGNSLDDNVTWHALDVPYAMANSSSVDSDLTIDAGATFAFDAQAELTFGSDAIIRADGTAEDPILFTSLVEEPGRWNGIHVENSDHPDNVMNYVIIEYGGREAFHGSTEPANLTLGRSLRNAGLTLTNSILRHSDGYGLYIHWGSSMPNSVNNTYTGNDNGAARANTNGAHYFDSGSDFTGNLNGNDFVRIDGNTADDSDVTWQALNVPYVMTGTSDIDDVELTIEPGAAFAFDAHAALEFSSGSAIRAIGTEDDPILFTGTEEVAGWWQGIHVSNSNHPNNEMDYVIIEYGGSESFHGSVEPANLVVGRSLRDAALTLTNSTIRYSDDVGLYVHSNGDINQDACDVNSFNNNNGADCIIEN